LFVPVLYLRNIKSICREFDGDYIWLTTGYGKMFVNSDDNFIEKIDRIIIDKMMLTELEVLQCQL